MFCSQPTQISTRLNTGRKSPVDRTPKCHSPLLRWKLVILLSKERSNDWQNYGPASRKTCHAPSQSCTTFDPLDKIQAKGWVGEGWHKVKNWCTLMYWDLGYIYLCHVSQRLCCQLEHSNLVWIIHFTNSLIIVELEFTWTWPGLEALIAAVLFQHWMEMNNCFAQLVVY